MSYSYRLHGISVTAKTNMRPSTDRTLEASFGRQSFDHIRMCQTQPGHRKIGVPYESQGIASSDHQDHDADIMNDWYQEWRTVPDDPLPSNIRPMSILSEPAWGHQNAPQRRPNEVWLDHYYPDMVPEGRAQRDLRVAHEERRYIEEDGERVVRQAERTLSRQDVIEAARRSNIVDLTGDSVNKSRDFWSVCKDRPQSERHKHMSFNRSRNSGMYHRSFHHHPSSRQDPPGQHFDHYNLSLPTRREPRTNFALDPYSIYANDLVHPHLRLAPEQPSLYDYSQPDSFDRRGGVNQPGHYGAQEPNRYMFTQ
jgi:hypothetical protein